MPKVTYNKVSAGFGPSIVNSVTRIAPIGTTIQTVVPKGKAGTLSTRTSDSVGTLTLGAGHGIVTGQLIDLYWSGGLRRQITVGTVAGTSVPIVGGAGTNLPIATTAIVASPLHIFSHALSNPEVHFLAWIGNMANGAIGVPYHIYVIDQESESEADVDLLSGDLKVYDIVDGGDVNPLIACSRPLQWTISNGSGTQDLTFNALILHDPTGESSS